MKAVLGKTRVSYIIRVNSWKNEDKESEIDLSNSHPVEILYQIS